MSGPEKHKMDSGRAADTVVKITLTHTKLREIKRRKKGVKKVFGCSKAQKSGTRNVVKQELRPLLINMINKTQQQEARVEKRLLLLPAKGLFKLRSLAYWERFQAPIQVERCPHEP